MKTLLLKGVILVHENELQNFGKIFLNSFG